ncbi:methyl-accepting chemotaxis protein [Archaeoglobus neptunius]|uniref:methyl-accepting chemotaxis protein n=1 Tax=Archaeoglobus neptunius TaxID=2798580 RepID=UPI0019258D62
MGSEVFEVEQVSSETRSIEQIEYALKELIAGNWTVRLERAEDERYSQIFELINTLAADLGSLFGEMVKAMKETEEMAKENMEAISQLNAGMQQISSASQQIATGAENLSRLANSSHALVRETMNLFELLNDNIAESSKYANSAMEYAEQARESGEVALGKLKEMIHEIELAGSIVEELNNTVKNIGKVTERIKSIADQTNLLALNAAIEAARAGEHGRGFAVVADEVRKLAEESRKSTEEIAEIVRSVQEGTSKVIEAVRKAKMESDEGGDKINAALKMAEEIGNMVGVIGEKLQEVAKESRRGVEKLESLVKNIEEVASTAEEAAAASEESSAAIEEQTAAVQQIANGSERLLQIAQDNMEVLMQRFRNLT